MSMIDVSSTFSIGVSGLRALAVDAQIAGDPVKPRPHLCAVRLPGQRFFSEPQQRLLRDILGLDPVAQPAPGE